MGGTTGASTVIVRTAVVLPAEFVAVTVYVEVGETTVGFPEMTPIEVLRLRPPGSAGETE
jgi:hypothetical protein